MNIGIGDKVIVTTSAWFYGHDGVNYQAVYGTVKAILNDEQTLGIKTNRNATNWYLEIGNMLIAGCQINYACKVTGPPPDEVKSWHTHPTDASTVIGTRPSAVYNADGEAWRCG